MSLARRMRRHNQKIRAARKKHSDRRGYRHQERRNGIDHAMAAEAATRNAADALSGEQMASYAVRFIESFATGANDQIWEDLRDLADERFAEMFATNAFLPRKTLDPSAVIHCDYLESLISPSGNREVEGALVDALGLENPLSFAVYLQWLKTECADAHDAILRADFEKALGAAAGHRIVRIGRVAAAAGTYWKYLIVRTAHRHMDVVADANQNPNGGAFAGFTGWKSASHMALSTLAGPADLIHRLTEKVATGQYATNDDEVLANALSDGFLSVQGGSAIHEAARIARLRLNIDARTGMDVSVLNALNHARDGCWKAALLVKGDTKRDVLKDLEPISWRLDVSTAEVAAFIAEEMLAACRDVDNVIRALVEGAPLPARSCHAFPIKTVGFLANALRAEAQSDRHAGGVRMNKNGKPAGLNADALPGRSAVRSLREKLRDPATRERLIDLFGIDLDAWLPQVLNLSFASPLESARSHHLPVDEAVAALPAEHAVPGSVPGRRARPGAGGAGSPARPAGSDGASEPLSQVRGMK